MRAPNPGLKPQRSGQGGDARALGHAPPSPPTIMPRAAGSRAAPAPALLAAVVAAALVAGGAAQRPRSEWEKAILYKYGDGWADPTPGGCDNTRGNECGPWRQEPVPWSQGKQKYAMKSAKKWKVSKKWKVRALLGDIRRDPRLTRRHQLGGF